MVGPRWSLRGVVWKRVSSKGRGKQTHEDGNDDCDRDNYPKRDPLS